jgi:predicted oxidoreductase
MAHDGPEFSRIVQGLASSMRWGKSPRELLEHVAGCVDMGVTTLDIAAAYGGGEAEVLLGEALALDRSIAQRVEIVTKCSIGTWDTSLYHYDTSREHIEWSVDQSLTKLQRDHVDLLLIHRPDPLMNAGEVAETFDALRQSGKVLHFGVSNFNPSQFELLSSRLDLPLVTNEVQFSVMYLDTYNDGTLDLCQRRRIAPMIWGPLGGGKLFREDSEKAGRLRNELASIGQELDASMDQIALAWLLKHPARLVPILGTGKIERVESATHAEQIELTREQWFRLWVASTGERMP